jgi:hypothetical protein
MKRWSAISSTNGTGVRRSSRTPLRRTLSLLALLTGVAGGIWAWAVERSIALSIYVFYMLFVFVGRGLGDVVTDPKKVRRFLYFSLNPVFGTAILVGTYRLWGMWWLSAILGVLGGAVAWALLGTWWFPAVNREEEADTESRRRGRRGGGREGGTMGFESQPQQDVHDRAQKWLEEMFGMFLHVIPGEPAFFVQMGQTLTFVSVQPWGDDDATITSRAYVAMDTEMTADLMHFLLQENDKFRFGAFGIDEDEDIFFEHTIVGSTLDQEELKSSVVAVSNTADRYADQIIPKWGGERQGEKLAARLGRS